MAKSLEEIYKKLEDERLEKLHVIKIREQKIYEEKEKQRQRYLSDMKIYEVALARAAAIAAVAAASAGGSKKSDEEGNSYIDDYVDDYVE
jgi:4-aminobutyrate aminotransferase-like enzyme